MFNNVGSLALLLPRAPCRGVSPPPDLNSCSAQKYCKTRLGLSKTYSWPKLHQQLRGRILQMVSSPWMVVSGCSLAHDPSEDPVHCGWAPNSQKLPGLCMGSAQHVEPLTDMWQPIPDDSRYGLWNQTGWAHIHFLAQP